MDWPTLFHLISAVVIAFLTSSFTVWLSLRKFRSQRIWDQKFDAYKKIIEWFYLQKEYWIVDENDGIGVKRLTNEDRKVWEERKKISEEELFKMRDIGALIISDRAIVIINRYYDQIHKADGEDYFEYTDKLFKIAKDCLADFVIEAKKDLA